MSRKNKFVLTIETDRASDIARLLRQQADHLDKYPLDDMPLRSYEGAGGGIDSEVKVVLNEHLKEEKHLQRCRRCRAYPGEFLKE